MPIAASWSDEHNPAIPNGRFTITDLGGNVIYFVIHTVQSGTLENLRIVKYKTDTMLSYKGFATLQDDGSIRVWRSMQDIIPARMPAKIGAAIGSIANGSASPILGDRVAFSIGNTSYTVHVDRITCIRCNATLRHAHIVSESVYSRWCDAHLDAYIQHRRSIEQDERVVRYESRRARRVVTAQQAPAEIYYGQHVDDIVVSEPSINQLADAVDNWRTLRISSPVPARARRSTRPAPPASDVLLSENGTGLVR